MTDPKLLAEQQQAERDLLEAQKHTHYTDGHNIAPQGILSNVSSTVTNAGGRLTKEEWAKLCEQMVKAWSVKAKDRP